MMKPSYSVSSQHSWVGVIPLLAIVNQAFYCHCKKRHIDRIPANHHVALVAGLPSAVVLDLNVSLSTSSTFSLRIAITMDRDGIGLDLTSHLHPPAVERKARDTSCGLPASPIARVSNARLEKNIRNRSTRWRKPYVPNLLLYVQES